MFQPSPVKSSSSLAEIVDDTTIESRARAAASAASAADHSSSSHFYMLSNSPHPVLDGVSLDNKRKSNAMSKQNDDERDYEEQQLPSKRPYYTSDSEFVDSSTSRNETASGRVVDMKSDVKMEQPEEDEEVVADDDEKGNDNNNYSDDEVDDSLTENASTEIPTLETYIPREPSYDKANAIPFAQVCKRLESLWNLRFTKRKVLSKQQKLECLLPNALKTYLDGGSPFPYLRLILPEHDSSRAHTGMKEARMAEVWAKAMGCDKGTAVYKQLTGFRSAHIIKNPNSVGDLSCVIADVMKERLPSSGSKLTVGEVNEWLDVLVAVVKNRVGTTTADGDRVGKSAWRKALEKAVVAKETAKKYDKYAILVEKLINKNLSPVEHKFIVRIILQHIHVGINLREILGYMHPNAMDLHYASNSLKELCALLSDPEYVRLLKATVEKNTREIMESNRLKWMTPSTLPAVLGNTISPMLSRRTSFHTFLQELAQRHDQLDKALPAESPAKSCLAIKHPAFTCEIKMDGERDLVHINRGIVTIQTRNGTWYSTLYSPAIGPALRAAISKYDVDVILDGEMISWDSAENKPIPFGSNRAVAEMNRNQRCRDGTLDPRDVDLHKNDMEINVMALSKDPKDGSSSRDMDEDQCWLQFVVFDLLYADGPDAQALIEKSRHLFAKDESIRTGSLINLSCIQRYSILYNLIEPQDKVVEHIRRVVIRPDGSSMDGADYFLGRSGLEYGKTPYELDSIYLALCDESGTTKFDTQRCSKAYEDIEIQRTLELERLYSQIVTFGGQEGLIFKDLASPYYLGSKSRSMGYWWKLKPDYDQSSAASDIDLLVLGGYYATGFSRRGMMSSLIVGCLDTEHRYGGEGAKYMAVTKVFFNKDTEKVLRESTGYRVADEYGQFNLGKWFESEELPSFISLESYQRSPVGDRDGWKPEKKDRPDLWINPNDSFVITVNAAELTVSHSMQAGLTMRFPRITEYRGKRTKNPKNPDEVADWSELRTIFDEQEETRQNEISLGSEQQETSRFLTAKQLQTGKLKAAKKSRKTIVEVKQFNIPGAAAPLSQILDGYTFTVLPGNYCLEDDAYATAEAKEDGWESSAITVRSQKDVIRFIQSHGGTCLLTMHTGTDFLLGGRVTDAPVSNLRTLMANTDRNSTAKKETDARKLLELGGILKWTFVYSVVSKFLTSLDDDLSGYTKSIKRDWPTLAHPHQSDFLVMSDTARTNFLHSSEDKYGLRINEVARHHDFLRALEEVRREKSKRTKLPWQVHAMSSFDEKERWIFGGKMQKLWPYGKYTDTDSPVIIMYPDLFATIGHESQNDANIESESPRWKQVMESKSLGRVAATLPLAKAMGAIITPHLHNGVTHILCDLKRHKMLSWSSMNPLSLFSDAESGSRLHERLISLEEAATVDCTNDVMLVSPDWLEEKWTCHSADTTKYKI